MTPREPSEAKCNCFGDSGLTASTHNSGGLTCCDLCGKPIQAGAVDVLTAINADRAVDASESPTPPSGA